MTPTPQETTHAKPNELQNDHYSHDDETPMIQLLDPHEQPSRSSVYRHESFLVTFATSRGPPQIVILCLLLAMGLGCTIGVVPAVMTDRYARLHHNYTGTQDCALYIQDERPDECLEGSNDAQNSAAVANLISNTLTFFSSSLIGSISDETGRKAILVLGIFLAIWHPFFLVLMQLKPTMSPTWYYGSSSITGFVNWIAVALSALSDVMPSKWRAPSFGLFLAGFSLGFALSPILAVILNHFWVSVLSFALVLTGFVITILFFPETLPPEVSMRKAMLRAEQQARMEEQGNHHTTCGRRVWSAVTRPMRELSILGRNRLFKLLTTLAFFSGMVTSGDQTLLIYYVEDRLGFNDNDVALLFFLIGMLGILVQGVLIKPINDVIGERLVVAMAFTLGSVTNFLYGIAKIKSTIFIAICIGTFAGMSFPTISAIKANNVSEAEQGRIQGALYSVQALASAVGPMSLRYVYRFTKDSAYPGTMFIFASMLYLVAMGCACALPKDQANSRNKSARSSMSSQEGYDQIIDSSDNEEESELMSRHEHDML